MPGLAGVLLGIPSSCLTAYPLERNTVPHHSRDVLASVSLDIRTFIGELSVDAAPAVRRHAQA